MTYSIPNQMQAIQVQNPGKQSQLHWQTVAVPRPATGQLLLKVAACGINRADLMQRQGLYPAPAGDSEILGLEAAGTVVAVGDSSLLDYQGQRYFGLVNGGGYAEYVLMPAGQAMPVPPAWTMLQAAATAETFLTAYQLLFTIGNATAGQRVLIHAGASGVGTSAIQLAKAKGLQVAVTVGTADKVSACLKLGADLAINYRQEDFAKVLHQAWPAGAMLVLDPVAAAYTPKNISVLAPDGKIVVYAMMGGRTVPELDLSVLFRKRGQIVCSTLRNRDLAYKSKLTAAFQHEFASLLNAGTIAPLIQQHFAATEVEAAHRLLASNQTIGKLVLSFEA